MTVFDPGAGGGPSDQLLREPGMGWRPPTRWDPFLPTIQLDPSLLVDTRGSSPSPLPDQMGTYTPDPVLPPAPQPGTAPRPYWQVPNSGQPTSPADFLLPLKNQFDRMFNWGPAVDRVKQDAANVDRYVNEAATGIETALGGVKDSAWDILTHPQPTRGELLTGAEREAGNLPPLSPERQKVLDEYHARATKFVGAGGTAIAKPFTEITGAIGEAQVRLDPTLSAAYDQRLGALPPGKVPNHEERQALARETLDAEAARLIRMIDDPNVPEGAKRAAFAAASLITLQRVTELGGPWILSQLARLGVRAAGAATDALAGRALAPASANLQRGLGRATGETAAPTGLRGELNPVTRVGYRSPLEPQVPIEGALGEPAGFGGFARGEGGAATVETALGKTAFGTAARVVAGARKYIADAVARDTGHARAAQNFDRTATGEAPKPTWVFTDVQGSTDIVKNQGPQVFSQVMEHQNGVLNEVFTNHGGELVRSTGDGFFYRFPSESQAASAAAEAQRRFGHERWPAGVKPQVRIGMHAGPAVPGTAASGVDWVGEPIHLASRVTNTAKGGEIAMSNEVARATGLVDIRGGAPVGTVHPGTPLKDYGPTTVYKLRPEDIAQMETVSPGLSRRAADIERQLHEPQYRLRDQQQMLDPERAARVGNTYWQKFAPGAAREKKALLVYGYPGSGKSTIARPGGAIDTTGYLPMGADDFKPLILDDYAATPSPRYVHGPIGENNIYRASDDLRSKVQARAIEGGYNFVAQPIGRNPAKELATIQDLKNRGYTVQVAWLDVPAPVAVSRTINRFEAAGGLDSTARFIRPGYTYGAVGKPQALVQTLLSNLTSKGGVKVDGLQIWNGAGRTPALVYDSAGKAIGAGSDVSRAGVRSGGGLVPRGREAGGPVDLSGNAGPPSEVGRGPLPTGQVISPEGKPNAPSFGMKQFPPGAQGTLMRLQEAVAPQLEAARPRISFAEQNVPTQKPIWELAAEMPRAGEVSQPAAQLRQQIADVLQGTQNYRAAIDQGTITPAQTQEYATLLAIAAHGRIAEVGAVGEAGRTLGGVNMPLNQALRTSATTRAIDELFADIARNDPTKLDTIATSLSHMGNDPRKVIRMMKLLDTKPDFWTRFDEYYRGNVLWNITTHVTNTASGLFQQALLAAEQTGMGALDVATLRTTPKQFGIEEIGMLRGWAQGYVQAFDMLRGARDMLPMSADKYGGAMGFRRTGALGTPGEHGVFGTQLGQGAAGLFNLGKYYGPVLRTPFKFLEAADLFQTAPMYNGLLWRNAYRLAYKEGVRGVANLDGRVQEILRTLPDTLDAEGAFKAAEQFALHGTGDAAEAIIKLRQKVPIMRPIVLFINTPANLVTMSAKFSPLGFARAGVGTFKVLKGLPTEIDPKEAFVDASIGSAVTAGFYMMLQGDNAVGLTPKSKAEQAAWEAEGRQPLSIRASEYPLLGPALRAYYAARGEDATKVWVGPQLLGPLLIPYLISAAAHEVGRTGSKDPIENQIATAVANAGKTMLDQIPLFSTYGMITNALDITNPDAFGRLLARLALPTIPLESLVKMVTTWTDGFRRDPKTFEEVLRATLPGLSGTVRKKLDVLGRPLPSNVVPFDVGPRARKPQPEDPVLTESERVRQAAPEEWSGLVKVPKAIGAQDLTYDEHNRYQELAGEERRKLLYELIQMPEYQKLRATDQGKALTATDAEARREGRKRLGLEMADAAPDNEALVRAVDVAFNGANSNYEKGQVLQQLADKGKLKSAVANQLDSRRTQPEPVRPGYQLSVAEYMRGVQLVDQYRAAPAFVVGESDNQADWPKEWSSAADAALTYNAIRDTFERSAKINSLPIQQVPGYDTLVRYYTEAAGGLLRRYYSLSGSVREGLVSQERKAIKADPLWSHFAGSAEPQPAVPYRFPVPYPELPASGSPSGQQNALQPAV